MVAVHLSHGRVNPEGWCLPVYISRPVISLPHSRSLGIYPEMCVLLCRVFLNPGAGKRRTGIQSSPWAAQEGQDFLANHVVPSIDLVTTHIWADNWMG